MSEEIKDIRVVPESECCGCAACANACPVDAIRMEEGKEGFVFPKVDLNTCIQCGKCARTCKQGAITQNAKGVYMINKKLCTGCGECVAACPMKVMTLGDTATKCIACGICAKACPMGILSVVEK